MREEEEEEKEGMLLCCKLATHHGLKFKELWNLSLLNSLLIFFDLKMNQNLEIELKH